MPISSSAKQIASLIGGSLLEPCEQNIIFEGLEFDSREIRGGELFIALAGEKVHGNHYIETAIARGASLVVAESLAALPELTNKSRVILVKDTLKAFWHIAAWWRDQVNLPTFAVTGSVGKTTVKEMTAAILLQRGVGTYSLKSHNNHVGVPYTICRSSRDHNWLVLEIGMNHRGEIAALSELAQPNVAAVTNIAPAHIGNLGSLEIIADEKLEISKGLRTDGSLLLNSQSSILKERLAALNISERLSCYYFGTEIKGDGELSNIQANGLEGIRFNLQIANEILEIKMKVLGRQNAWNAACAAMAAKFLCPNITAAEIVSGLSRFTAPLMRLNTKYLSDASIVIDDSYNANPASMRCAIELLADISKPGQRMGLVLGDMLELGEFSEKYHKEISLVIESLSPSFLIAVGSAAKDYIGNLESKNIVCKYCPHVSDAIVALREFDFDFLLVKASRGVGLDAIVKELIERKGELPYEPQLASQANS